MEEGRSDRGTGRDRGRDRRHGLAPGPPDLSGRSRTETGTQTSELAGLVISIQVFASSWGPYGKSPPQLKG